MKGFDLKQLSRNAAAAGNKAGVDAIAAAELTRAMRGRKERPDRDPFAPNIHGDAPDAFWVDVKTQTECNTEETYWAKARRAKLQRERTRNAMIGRRLPALPVVVTFTRHGPGALDPHDNYPSAIKHICDKIAETYGVPDNDPRIAWKYAPQVRQKRCMVRVEITPVRPATKGATP